MNPHALRVRALFGAALEMPPEQRDHYLRTICDEDEALRLEVMELLAASHAADFLEPPELAGVLPRTTPTCFGPYQVEAQLDDDVWLARAATTGRRVRVEVMAAPASEANLAIAQFVRQAHGIERLASRLAVRVHEHRVEGHSLWVAMDHVEGPSLADELRLQADPSLPGPRQLPPCASAGWLPAIADLTARLSTLLAEAHAAGLAHGEVTARRIVLEAPERPRLLGFGWAALRPRTPTARDDLQALGALLDSMLALASESVATARGRALCRVIKRATSTGRASYATMATMADDLRRIASTQPAAGKRPFESVRNWLGRHLPN